MNKPAAIYARVSSDRRKENHTIASQTEALKEFARTHSYMVPPEWVFQDEGYSGAILARPGLESLRDLAAEGQIRVVLVYSPDRLSRKYAYQILLAEEFSRCGVELIFLKSPAGATPEDQLLVQFQGMIAEYERAQIAERSRRGKRHKAHQGVINVLSGAPYGYRYVRKTETSAAYYEVIEAEAQVVRLVFEAYTQQGLSINAIARMLNERQIPTRTAKTRWERSTVWGILRNPAYQGKACYGKTELRPRQRITRPLRQRKGLPSWDSANHERPRQDWIEVPVTPLVSEELFTLAQEQLARNNATAIASASTGESPPDAIRPPSPVSQMTRTSDHRHICRSVVQKKRSRRFSEGRGRLRLSTATCCRSARISSEVSMPLRKKARMAARNAVIKSSTNQPL